MVVEAENETEPSWLSILAWPVAGAALAISVLGAMTIGLYVLPLAIAALFALLRWGGNRRNSIGLISGVGLPFLFIAFRYRHGPPGMVCRPSGDGGQQCAQVFSPWPLLIIGAILVLLGTLLFMRLRSDSNSAPAMFLKENAMKRWSSTKIRYSGLLVLTVVAIVFWFILHGYQMNSNEATRVQQGFDHISVAVAHKAGITSLELAPVYAGIASYPDGTKASLWVSNPAPLGIRSGCFYFDITTRGLASGGQSNTLCGEPGSDISLERTGIGAGVVGFVGLWPAHTVSVTAAGIISKLPVTFGYFIVPGSQSVDPAAKFAIALMSKDGVLLGTVTGLKAPGRATLK